jgi:RNA polymerase sigma-70 factor (ECF subfamily)
MLQDVYLKVCGRREMLSKFIGQDETAIFAYLRVVAINVVNDMLRQRIAARRGGRPPVALSGELQAGASDRREAADQLERTLLLGQIDRILEQLGPESTRDRTIFWLYYRQGLTSRAIASISALQLGLKGVEAVLLRLTRLVRSELTSRTRVIDRATGFSGETALSKENDA